MSTDGEAAAPPLNPEVVKGTAHCLHGNYIKGLSIIQAEVERNPRDEITIEIFKVLKARHESQQQLVTELAKDLKFPLESEGMTCKLKDDRLLGYQLFGATEDQVKRHLMFCHGTPGSRLFFTPTMEGLAREKGVQVIVVERPGFGLSSFKEDRTILDFANDLAELLDHLKIDPTRKVSILGFSAGGPFALGCAKLIPQRVSSVLLVSSPSPPEAPHASKGMTFMNKIAYFVSKTWYWGLKTAVKSEADATVKNPIKKMQENLATAPGDAQAFMTNPEIERVFVLSALEMYSRPHGSVAEAIDYWLFSHPWGFDLQTLSTEVKYHVWYGQADESVVPPMGEYLGKQLPGCKVDAVDEKGHLLFFDVWGDVLDAALLE